MCLYMCGARGRPRALPILLGSSTVEGHSLLKYTIFITNKYLVDFPSLSVFPLLDVREEL